MKLEHPDRLMNRTPLSLAALETHDAFAERHIGPDAASQQAMLDTLGFATRAALIDAVIPASIRRAETLPLGPFAQPKRSPRCARSRTRTRCSARTSAKATTTPTPRR